MAEPKVITAAAALKAFSSQRLRITDFERDKSGNVVLSEKKGNDGKVRNVPTPETRAVTEADVLSAVAIGNTVVMVTADGKRYSNAAAADAS